MKQININGTGSIILRYLPYLVILILISVLFSKCENERVQTATIHALTTENKHYKLKNGQLVTSTEIAYFDKNQMKKLLEKELANKFSNIKTVTKVVTNTVIDTVKIVYTDSIPCRFEKYGSIIKNDYSLNYKSNQSGITLSSIVIPDSITFVSGVKRKWFLGKETHTVDIKHSNSLIKDNSIQSFELKDKKRFYETTLFKVGVGILIGVSIR